MVAWAAAAPIIGAGISAIGGMMGNRSAAKEGGKQRHFERYMSDTAHRREVADLKAAGLNPMLSGMGGSGASTPSVGIAQQRNPFEGVGDLVADAIPKSALVEQTQANTAKLKADTMKSVADTELSTAQAAEARERTTTYPVQNEKVSFEIPKILADAELSRTQTGKVSQEIENLVLSRDLTHANIAESLARAGLTTAQIREVQPRIDKLIQETAHTRASIGKAEILGLPGNMLRELLTNSAGSDSTLGGSLSSGLKSGAKDFKDSMRRNRSNYDNRRN